MYVIRLLLSIATARVWYCSPYDVLHDLSELVLLHADLGVRQAGDDVGHDVVQGVPFSSQLGEKQLCQVGDLADFVDDAKGHIGDLTADLKQKRKTIESREDRIVMHITYKKSKAKQISKPKSS